MVVLRSVVNVPSYLTAYPHRALTNRAGHLGGSLRA
jgi:hypothetical protein